MKKKVPFIVTLLLLLIVQTACIAQNADTIIDRKHYNTVVKYHHFDYKGEPETSFITAYGTLKDSVKTGKWMYVLPDGRVLAIGKFKDGYKTGNWKYLGSGGHYFSYTWRKFEKVSDYVYFEDNIFPVLIDYDTKLNRKLKKNGAWITTMTPYFL
ncbi:MAG: hypothetical protein JWP12_3741 [Bacteroidetes bacterium]|nr:hypothetical protein [Bacteroidota bacterium]